MLVLNLPTLESKRYLAYDRFHGNGPYDEIPSKKSLKTTLPLWLATRVDQMGLSCPLGTTWRRPARKIYNSK